MHLSRCLAAVVFPPVVAFNCIPVSWWLLRHRNQLSKLLACQRVWCLCSGFVDLCSGTGVSPQAAFVWKGLCDPPTLLTSSSAFSIQVSRSMSEQVSSTLWARRAVWPEWRLTEDWLSVSILLTVLDRWGANCIVQLLLLPKGVLGHWLLFIILVFPLMFLLQKF